MRRLTAGLALGACAPEKKARAIWLDAPCLRLTAAPRGTAGGRFDATSGSSTANYYLRTGFALSTAAGTARTSIDQFVNSSVGCSGRPFTPFGTWSISP